MLVNAHDHLSHYKQPNQALEEISKQNIFTLAVSETIQDYLEIPEHPLILKGFGIHPAQVTPMTSTQKLLAYLDGCDFIGEIGLDFHWVKDETTYPNQIEIFTFFLKEAKSRNKICNIHTKGAEKLVLELLRKYQPPNPIIHWYSGQLDLISDYLDLGCFFTISVDVGISPITDQLVKMLPPERILFETDGPTAGDWVYNTPSYPSEIKKVRQEVKRIKNLPYSAIDQGSKKLLELLHKH